MGQKDVESEGRPGFKCRSACLWECEGSQQEPGDGAETAHAHARAHLEGGWVRGRRLPLVSLSVIGGGGRTPHQAGLRSRRQTDRRGQLLPRELSGRMLAATIGPRGWPWGVTAIRTPGPAPAHCQALPGLPCQLLGASRTPSLLAVLTERDLSRGGTSDSHKIGGLRGTSVWGESKTSSYRGQEHVSIGGRVS